MTDEVFQDILGWAKGIAIKAGDETLDIEHILLGAMKCRNRYPVLQNFMTKDPDFEKDLRPTLKDAYQTILNPVVDKTMHLSPRLQKIINETWQRHNMLATQYLLSNIRDNFLDDVTWARGVFKTEDSSPAKIQGLIEAITKVQSLQDMLSSRIIGQEMAIDHVCDAFFYPSFHDEKDESGKKKEGKGPLAVLTFLGPPGVGKTYMAELIAEYFSEGKAAPNLLRIDMSAYSGHQSHEQLIGFNAAYSGATGGILTGFIKKNPGAIILADEIEKAHRNTQNIFLQILDYGKLYENNSKEWVDCSQITMIFTTNLGRELYNTPDRFGLLRGSQHIDDVIMDALGKDLPEQGTSQDHNGLTPEMLSRLAKGKFVLFERLDALALERIAQKTIEAVSYEFQKKTGLKLEAVDPIILTLLILRFGINADARRLTTGLSNYLYESIKDILVENRTTLIGEEKTVLSRAQGFSICLPSIENLPEHVKNVSKGTSNVLVIDEGEWPVNIPENVLIHKSITKDEVDDLLRSGTIDYILLDLNIGVSPDDPAMDKSLEFLHWIRNNFPEVPLYLFSESPDRRKLSLETLQSVARQGGARGVLQKLFFGNGENDATNRNAFFNQLREIDSALRREKVLAWYRRHLKILEFDLVLRPELTSTGFLRLEIGRIRETMTVFARDRSHTGWVDIPTQRFEDIVGADHAKIRLQEISRWLTEPGKLRDMGLELPKGILLTGPPGTGKTSLARAVAGESQVPFFAFSGSDVLSKWVGESEANIREIFTRARDYAPSIIFIDEIDGIGGRRNTDSQDYTVSILNQLLAQMDGFSQEAGRPVFIMAATNRPDMLDPALVRPGRFDLQIEVALPSFEARKDMFSFYLDKASKDGDISAESLAARSTGMSGAEIRQACKEAGWLAYRENHGKISQRHVYEAITSIRMGLSSERLLLDESTKRSTAIHEAGHVIAQLRLFSDEPVAQVSILPRGKALGFMEHENTPVFKDLSNNTIARKVQVLLAGRIAEEIILGSANTTAGCANDLERASQLAAERIASWGMNTEIGLVNFAGVKSGLNSGDQMPLPESILAEIKTWISEQADSIKALLVENRNDLERLADELVKKETLAKEEINTVISQTTP